MNPLIFSRNQYLKKDNIEVGCFVSDKVNFHAHDFIELVYFDTDNVCHRVEDEYFTVNKGDIFLLNTGVSHTFSSNDPKTPEVSVYNCLFEPKALNDILTTGSDFVEVMYHRLFHNFVDGCPAKFIHLKRCVEVDFKELITKMVDEKQNKRPGWQSKLSAYLNLLLVDVLRIYNKQITDTPLEDTQKNIVDSMIEFMNSRLGEEVHVQMMADTFFFSPSYLNRVFKNQMQISILQYLRQLRMEEAGKLLLHTKKNVGEIASEVGYTDMKHFYRLFKSYYGMSPKDYRNKQT